jgi:hypothetical protein
MQMIYTFVFLLELDKSTSSTPFVMFGYWHVIVRMYVLQAVSLNSSTLHKLQFVLCLVRCLLDLAESRQMSHANGDGVTSADSQLPSHAFRVSHARFLTKGQCCVEQLVLYIRALHLLSSALHHAKAEMKAGVLLPSTGMKSGK